MHSLHSLFAYIPGAGQKPLKMERYDFRPCEFNFAEAIQKMYPDPNQARHFMSLYLAFVRTYYAEWELHDRHSFERLMGLLLYDAGTSIEHRLDEYKLQGSPPTFDTLVEGPFSVLRTRTRFRKSWRSGAWKRPTPLHHLPLLLMLRLTISSHKRLRLRLRSVLCSLGNP